MHVCVRVHVHAWHALQIRLSGESGDQDILGGLRLFLPRENKSFMATDD